MSDPIGDDDHTDRMERDRVVAWLLEEAERCPNGSWGVDREALRRAADDIEHGRHYAGHEDDER